MGRSSKEEAARTRERIVQIASDLFRKTGVDQVSVAEIMAASGLTIGGFYKHFESKEALVAEAVALAFSQSSTAWESAGKDAGALAGLRRALVNFYLREAPDRRCPIIAFAPLATTTTDEAAPREYLHGVETLLSHFTADDAKVSPDALVLFAAMIGARVLGEATGNAPWTQEIRQAVLAAADDRIEKEDGDSKDGKRGNRR